MIRILVVVALCAHLLAPIAAYAQEQVKDPVEMSLKQWLFVIGMALLGGFVSWWSKVRKGELPMWSVNHFVGELATSAFAGLICFFICAWAGFPPLLTGACTGICGHMGTRALTMFEKWMETRFNSMASAKAE